MSIRCAVNGLFFFIFLVTFLCFWRIWLHALKYIQIYHHNLHCHYLCLKIVLYTVNFTMLNTACCVGLLCWTVNSVCPSCYIMMMMPVPCNVCMIVLLYILPSLLSLLLMFFFILPPSCFCSINKIKQNI